MESLSRPFHRRKLSNAKGKNAYDGVFSGHRPKFDGAPTVHVDDYREIFSNGQTVSSIPILDLSNLEHQQDGDEASDGLKPDYDLIFGGFRDSDVAVSYQELIARDKARSLSSTNSSSQDFDDQSHQSFDALKQFNLSYNKISQRCKDGLDGTTHVTQLHAVPGFTCFIDEPVSQPNKESENQKSSVTNNVSEKQNAVESRSNHHQDNSLSGDKNSTTFQNVASSAINETFSQLKKETENQKSSVTNERRDESISDDTNSDTFQADFNSNRSKISSPPHVASASNNETSSQPKKKAENQTSSKSAVESKRKDRPDESLSDGFKSCPSKISLPPPVASVTNVDSHNGYQRRSTATNNGTHKSDTSVELPPTWFGEELDVNSSAAISAAALRKAIEKAQESIRIAKESVGRKKEGFRGYSSKSFKDSLKVKRRVSNIRTVEEQKEKDDKMKMFSNESSHRKQVINDQKVFGAKKVINDVREKIAELTENSEMPVSPSHELKEDKNICDSKEAIDEKTSFESIENNTYQSNGYVAVESCEKMLEDEIDDDKGRESNENIDEVALNDLCKLGRDLSNLTLYREVENEKNDQNGYDKSCNEISGLLLENKKQEVVEKERDETVVSSESDDEASEKVLEDEIESKDNESRKLDDTGETFYDVCEAENVESTQTSGTNEVSQNEEEKRYEKLDQFQEPQIYDNSSSDYDDAEESESVHIVFDTQKECKVDENDDNSESGPEINDVRSVHEFQVEETEAIEKDIFEDVSANRTSSDEDEDKSDDVPNCVLADVEFGRNDVRSGSFSDTIRCMEIETTISQKSHGKKPEIRTTQERKDESGESGPTKVVKKEGNFKRIKEVSVEEKERERVKLAVERAIREARERAFMEARERAEKAAVEKVVKTSAQSKLKAERAAVERATSEARQRALEKAMSLKKTSEVRVQVNDVKPTFSSVSHTNGESALRSKAKLEKHNRIMERVAKALAEKEKRDMLVLKEQTERSRISDTLDNEIKRWSTGKEGNLRALLSTLQYVLGAESGWKPVTLTEIITTAAVKKAYRKATLCVHPDKLQQRGASIQQKYICEKVFDLLKAAWNRFNSEER